MALMGFVVWGVAYLTGSYISHASWLILLLCQMIIYLIYGIYIHNLYIQANRDILTGLSNRRYFTAEISKLSKMEFPISLMIADIDNFKKINDVYGHLAGDEILKQLADTFGQNIRQTELLSRWGGEEFTILLPGTNQEAALRIAEKLRSTIEKNAFDIDSSVISITVSIGIATIAQVIPPDQFVKLADIALHRAKEAKNVVIAYEESPLKYDSCHCT